MAFEEELAGLNQWSFFREFTFSRNTFRPEPSKEVELADSIIWIGGQLIIFQLKERDENIGASTDSEARWFEKKVLKKATRQIRDTLGYLRSAATIEIRNHRGHAIAVDMKTVEHIYSLVVYLPNKHLPERCRQIKYHNSQTAGLIHIIPAGEYLQIIRTLQTPTEIIDYLAFRYNMINKWDAAVDKVSESALVGHYISGQSSMPPSVEFIEFFQRLDRESNDWDISGILHSFPERMRTNGDFETSYYPIIRELALLKRNELSFFKFRFMAVKEAASENRPIQPFRMACPRTDCGFVFIALTDDIIAQRLVWLEGLTHAAKYDLQVYKCLGVAVGPSEEDWFDVDWGLIEGPWIKDAEFERFLRSNNPFRDVEEVELPSYGFEDGSQKD